MKHTKYKILNTKYKSGFTLVETLVALFIFSLSVTAIIVVTGQGVSDTTIAKNKIVAVALAQEGIEMVRNIRDTYALSEAAPGDGWVDFRNDTGAQTGQLCGNQNRGCIITNITNFFIGPNGLVNNPPTIAFCNPSTSPLYQSGCPFLTREKLQTEVVGSNINILSTLGFYSYNSNVPETPFKRTLYIECVGGCDEVRVESLVEWRQGSGIASVNAVEYLTNWFKTVAPTTP